MDKKRVLTRLRADLAKELKLARAAYRRGCASGIEQRRQAAARRLEQAEFAAGILMQDQVRVGAIWTWKETL